MKTIILGAAALLAGIGAAAAHETKLANLQIVHPWAHGHAGTGPTAPRDVAVFMTLVNTGGQPDRLLAVSSPLAESAELRTGEDAAGAIEVAAAGAVKMADKGAHLVLHGVTDDLAGYEAFPMWLTFERAGRVEVAVVVEDPAVKDPSCTGSMTPGEMKAHLGH